MRDAAKSLPPEQLLQLFEQAMGALWNRTHQTLGSVTLGAVTDRVVVNASEKFAPFESIKVETQGIDFRELRKQAGVFDDGDALAEGIRYVIVEFVSVIGNLTGDILTPGLYSELSKITLKDLALKGKHEGDES
jgi:hypothetical protein